jgi:hypothetical protein
MSRALRFAVCVALLALPACFQAARTGGAAGQTLAAREKGARQANESIAAGVLLLKEYPATPASAQHGEYVKLLKEKGIGYEVPALPTGVTDADFRAEVEGWNQAMTAEIQRKFGPTFLADLHAEADKRWEEQVKGRK